MNLAAHIDARATAATHHRITAGRNRDLWSIDEAGDDYLAVDVRDDVVLAQCGLVRRYQAVKQMARELAIESDIWDEEFQSLGEPRAELHTADSCSSYFRGPLEGRTRWCLLEKVRNTARSTDCGGLTSLSSQGFGGAQGVCPFSAARNRPRIRVVARALPGALAARLRGSTPAASLQSAPSGLSHARRLWRIGREPRLMADWPVPRRELE